MCFSQEPTFTIKNANLFCRWTSTHTESDDICAICLVPLPEMCTECQAKVDVPELHRRRMQRANFSLDTTDLPAAERFNVEDTALASEKRMQCPIDCGKCTHRFHSHCLGQWTRRHPICPLDKRRWELKATIRK